MTSAVRLSLLWCLLPFVSDLALAQKPAALRRELRLAVQKLDVDAESVAAVRAAIEAVASCDDEDGAAALFDAVAELDRRMTGIVEERRRVLAKGGGSARLKRSRYELRSVADSLTDVAKGLFGMKSPAALEVMLRSLTDRGSALPLWLRLQLAARVGELPDGHFDWRRLERGKQSEDTRLALLRTIATLGRRVVEGGAIDWVADQLASEHASVRCAAADAIARVGWPGGITRLIDQVEREHGEEREVMLDALVVLTGQNPGDSAHSWRQWLAAEGGPFVAGERELGKGNAAVRDRSAAAAAGGTRAGSYFGITQNGEAVLYVFDNSLSMKAKVGGGKAKGKGPTTGPAALSRWDLCKQELKRSLGELQPGQKFNLVSFANKARCFQGRMQEADERTVAAAIRWIDELDLEFETNVFDALELGFQIAGRGAEDRYYESEVDTIFFLSDGAPTIANLNRRGIGRDDCARILRAVRRWNALGRIKLHAVGLGLPPARRGKQQAGKQQKGGGMAPAAFLQRLAAENGGRYVSRR